MNPQREEWLETVHSQEKEKIALSSSLLVRFLTKVKGRRQSDWKAQENTND